MDLDYSIVTAKDVSGCFDTLHLNPHSNITRFLRDFSKRGTKQLFLKKDKGYVLLANVRDRINKELKIPVEILGSDSLYPLSIFDNSRDYLQTFSREASVCYDHGLYNSCLLTLRKIMETLLIDLYESKKLQSKITNSKGGYHQLQALINHAISEPAWKFTKTTREHLPRLKLYADSSAHSKRFNARKQDIDKMKEDNRIIFEELISHIDYRNFKI